MNGAVRITHLVHIAHFIQNQLAQGIYISSLQGRNEYAIVMGNFIPTVFQVLQDLCFHTVFQPFVERRFYLWTFLYCKRVRQTFHRRHHAGGNRPYWLWYHFAGCGVPDHQRIERRRRAEYAQILYRAYNQRALNCSCEYIIIIERAMLNGIALFY